MYLSSPGKRQYPASVLRLIISNISTAASDSPNNTSPLDVVYSPPNCLTNVIKAFSAESNPNEGFPVISVICLETSSISAQVVGTVKLCSSKNVLL